MVMGTQTWGSWPPHATEPRRWTAAERGGPLVPRAHRAFSYEVSVPPRIVGASLRLPGGAARDIERATVALARLEASDGLDEAVVPLLRTESAASSRIEQIEVGQRQVGRALVGLPAKRSAHEVAQNVRALQRAWAMADHPLSVELIHEIHRTLLPDVAWSGVVRSTQNWIGGSSYSPLGAVHVPPPPELVDDLLDDLVAFMGRDDLPAVVLAAISHAQFESIHPYPDGNGRTGRALVGQTLRRLGVVASGMPPLSLVLLADRPRYFRELDHYRQGDVGGLVQLFTLAVRVGAEAGIFLAGELAAIRSDWTSNPAVAALRSDAVGRAIVDRLTSAPVVDSTSVMERHDVARSTAVDALNDLERAGVLTSSAAARGLRVYEARDVFDAIERTEQWVNRRVQDG